MFKDILNAGRIDYSGFSLFSLIWRTLENLNLTLLAWKELADAQKYELPLQKKRLEKPEISLKREGLDLTIRPWDD